MKNISVFKQTASIFKNWSILFGKKTTTLWRGVESQTIFETQRKSSIFNKILFTGTNEINIGHFHSLFFLCLLLMNLSLINFFDCTMKPGIEIPLLGAYLKQPT